MKQSKDEQVLIEFLNKMTKDDSPFSEEITSKLIEKRSTLSDDQFKSIKEILEVKEIGEKTLSLLIELADHDKEEVKLRSRTIFSFLGAAPSMKEYNGKVEFEAVPVDEKEEQKGELRDYYLYYTSDLNKEQLFSQIKHIPNYHTQYNDPWFAIQIHDGRFLSVAQNRVGYAISIDEAEMFKFRTSPRGTFDNSNPNHRDHPQLYPRNSTLITAKVNNEKGGLYFAYEPGFKEGKVEYDPYNNNEQVTPHKIYNFDLYGINSEPIWAGKEYFKSFSLMNYWKKAGAYIPNDPNSDTIRLNSDDRKFITTKSAGLHGENRVGWLPENWYRYVDVVENVSFLSKGASSSNIGNWYLINDGTGRLTVTYVSVGNVMPSHALFDMYVFYGHWEHRTNIATRVVIRSKHNGKCLSVDKNNVVSCSQQEHDWNETFFVEEGWGGSIDDIVLKTAHGKYLFAYTTTHSGVVKADSVQPGSLEQFRVVYP